MENCLKIFDTIGKLNQHKKYHTKPYECQYCGISFGCKWDLTMHGNKCHLANHMFKNRKVSKFLKCNDCGLHQWSIFQKHRKNEHMINSFVCKICKKRFRSKGNLKEHGRTHLNMNEKNIFRCEMCFKVFGYRKTLRRHWRRFHTKNKE